MRSYFTIDYQLYGKDSSGMLSVKQSSLFSIGGLSGDVGPGAVPDSRTLSLPPSVLSILYLSSLPGSLPDSAVPSAFNPDTCFLFFSYFHSPITLSDSLPFSLPPLFALHCVFSLSLFCLTLRKQQLLCAIKK